MGFKIVIESFGDAVEVVTKQPDMGAALPKPGKEEGQPIFFDVILDISGSMREFYDELVNCFNDIMIPALQGSAERYTGAMRLGCLLFSNELVPAWRGFKSLEDLGPKPLQRSMLNQPGLQAGTSLYRAMRTGILWTAASIEQMRKNGKGVTPKGKIIVLTDGGNNEPPEDEAAVVQALTAIGAQNQQAFVERKRGQEVNCKVVGFFDTGVAAGGLTEPQFNAMAAATRFRGAGFYKIAEGGTIDERRRAFRHSFQMFSREV